MVDSKQANLRTMNNPDIALTIGLTTLLILILIAGITISFIMINKEKIRQNMKMTEAKLEFEQELRKVENEVDESTRKYFAQELHDNIGHLLTCLRLEIENRKLDQPELVKTLGPADAYLTETIDQLSLLSRSSNNDYLANIGLVDAINLEVDRQRKIKKLNVNWKNDGNQITLGKNQELIIFRVFQEILTNAVRHSKAGNLDINLLALPSFQLSIKDDGQGFSVNEMLKSNKASGLRNIIKRSEMAGLKCDIRSGIGQGCSYKIYELAKEDNES